MRPVRCGGFPARRRKSDAYSGGVLHPDEPTRARPTGSAAPSPQCGAAATKLARGAAATKLARGEAATKLARGAAATKLARGAAATKLAYPDETLHEVTLSRGFWLGRYEVTQAQWEAVMGANPSYYPGSQRPVETIGWGDVEDYLLIRNASSSGGTYRLPTEAEWEYACRAGTTTRYYWGDDADLTAIEDYAWFTDNSNEETHPVGEKLPNAWGLYDMTGNVDEWCQDWYGEYPDGPVTDPQGPDSGDMRVIRGGDWGIGARGCRSACRFTNGPTPDQAFEALGFRLLRTQD
ncbi:MAG: formylglycine-generating enzyme family protein [Planctomycetota bacterium]